MESYDTLNVRKACIKMSIKFIYFLVGLAIIIPATGFAAPSDEQALQAQIQALQQQISNLL